MIIGIDCSNIRGGGGITNIKELLTHACNISDIKIDKVIIWAADPLLSLIPSKEWVQVETPKYLKKSFIHRFFWQTFILKKVAKSRKCDVLYFPGGTYLGAFRPFVTISQNLLPFEYKELRRYFFSPKILKFFLLRIFQSISFKKANGLIFLTKYAEKVVINNKGYLYTNREIIPHGISKDFFCSPKKYDHSAINLKKKINILYVSIIDKYKHHCHVINAVNILRKTFPQIQLHLVGPCMKSEKNIFESTLNQFDPHNKWIHYIGEVQNKDLIGIYHNADIGVFASSCENLPLILLENMAAGIPIACSDQGPMPEVLKSGGIYFNPEKPHEITEALSKFLLSAQLCHEKATISHELSLNYSWESCANKTFKFIANTANNFNLDNSQK